MLTIREVIKTFYNALFQRLKKHRGNWDQNDPSADDYIKNRPFYTDNSQRTIIVPKQQITFSNNRAILTLSEFIEFVVGQTYEVKWDDVNYTCVAWDFNGHGIIGNSGMLGGPDTGEPFTMMISKAQGIVVVNGYTGTSTVEVTTVKVVKLDKKYLPDLGLAPVATSGSYYDLEDTPAVYSDVVRYDASQSLSTAQKQQARNNIGAVSSDEALAGVKTINGIEPDKNGNVDATSVTQNRFTMKIDYKRAADYGFGVTYNDLLEGYYGGSSFLCRNLTYDTANGIILGNQSGKYIQCKANINSSQEASITIQNSSSEGIIIYGDGEIWVRNGVLTFYTGAILRNIKTPENDNDAVNKSYVDTKVSDTAVIINSSTEGSTKRFKITVDDSGTISATEVIE